RAFDVPTGAPVAPWRRPERLARLRMLPKHEVEGIELGLVDLHARSRAQIVDSFARQTAVIGKLAHGVHYIAVAGDICKVFIDQGLRHRDDDGDEIGRPWLDIRGL